jgi:hypothetical protein
MLLMGGWERVVRRNSLRKVVACMGWVI